MALSASASQIRPPLSPTHSGSRQRSASVSSVSSTSSQQHKHPHTHFHQKQMARSVRHANAILRERDAQILSLQSEVNALSNKLVSLSHKASHHRHFKKSSAGAAHKKLPAFGTVIQSERDPHKLSMMTSNSSIGTNGGDRNRLSLKNRPNLLIQNRRADLARNASISTANALNALPETHDDPLGYIPNDRAREELRAITDRIQSMFKDPSSRSNMNYLRSRQFAADLLRLNRMVMAVLEDEPRVAFLQSPCYVFGDIHGNLEDLHFFSDNIWRLGMSLTAGNFVFLGDYVDRGMSCLEVVAYLLSMKLLLPQKVFLLRGNHETRDVNGWEEHYGARSFIHQCRERFGDDVGYRVWESCNQVFDRLPLSAVIDQDIFCVHGGIPRPIHESESGSEMSRIQDILGVPKVAGINPPYEHESEAYQQVASDCIWSDPASEEQEMHGVDPSTGFGESLRGGGAICFGHKAVTEFLNQQGYSYIMRAHEAHADGVAVSKGARVFTVFSTSKDHNQGSHAMAGCILVDNEKMRVINRSPAYKNQYIHRRDSVSLAMLSESEIEQRIELGLVTVDPDDEDEYDVEEWDDFDEGSDKGNMDGVGDEEEEEMHYVIDTRRDSIVDPASTVASPAGSSHDIHDQLSRTDASSAKKHFDFTTMEVQKGRGKSNADLLSPLAEASYDDEIEEDSTVDGNDGKDHDESNVTMEDATGSVSSSGSSDVNNRDGSLSPNTSRTVSTRQRKVHRARREYDRLRYSIETAFAQIVHRPPSPPSSPRASIMQFPNALRRSFRKEPDE